MISSLSTAIGDSMQAVSYLRRWTKPINRAVRRSPQPLIHPEVRLIVVFSPKAACTSVVAWFLHHLGQAEQARNYHESPHQYRIHVYNRSELYYRALNLDLSHFRVVRVVRDPIDRAASSFRHVQRTGIADHLFSAQLGLSEVASKGVSFRQFLDLLEQVNLATCNEHVRIQRHPVEDQLPVTHLINISTQDLFTRLNEVERDLKLPVTDFERFGWIRDIAERRGSWNGRIDVSDAYEMPLTRARARTGPWPDASALLTPPAQERLARLYAVDIAAYGRAPVREIIKDAPPPADRRAARRARRRQRMLKRLDRERRRSRESNTIGTHSGR
jgi:hypothetical protein